MIINFKIDRQAKRAVYRQIMSGITTMVQDGLLVPGDKLPSERELADFLGASRGTVKKAYDKLCTNDVAQSVIGSGTFISIGQDVIDNTRKHNAVLSIEALIENLLNEGFSYHEVETHFQLVINKYKRDSNLVKIATIDCSKEALYTFEQQLEYISNISIEKILLKDLKSDSSPMSKLLPYDLILTTSTHYQEVCQLLPNYQTKIMQAILSPERQTVIELAQIPKDKQVGSICLSNRYLQVIFKYMTRDIPMKNTMIVGQKDINLNTFLANKDYLVLPPEGIIQDEEILQLLNNQFKNINTIYFNYQIERGSLIHIEEIISLILDQKIGGKHE